ncbi:AMP-dependent synthetase and ligase [Luminiphilus syltensis NOR5-1B]|uniref:AMP-dependent synthetase and ligase n=1 Tax=Luminiphilus syltensis NOR5-1B TaxID=565045 RepID=B8KSR1_9GAMM|nr:AMP-dependent synthetase and ligase [Luminiphilus syltensis NOR5-1B]
MKTAAKTMNNIESTSYRNATLAERARLLADERNQETAIFFGNGSTLSFADAYREGRTLAAALQNMGLAAGDTLSFQLPNTRESVIVAIAASLAGLIINPIVPIYRGKELGFILKDAQTRVLFIPATLRNFNYVEMTTTLRSQLPDLSTVVVVGASGALPEGFVDFDSAMTSANADQLSDVAVDPDDEKIKLYTSGTTGNPKAVRHSHNTLEKALMNGVSGWSMDSNDLMLMPSPVTHITGYANGIELPFFSDSKSLLMEAWVVTEAVELIEKYGATLCVSATPFLRELVDTVKRRQTLPGFWYLRAAAPQYPPS